MAERRHHLGDVLNEAVRHKPSNDPAIPKSAHVTYSEIFWDTLLAENIQLETVEELNRLMNFLLTASKRDVRIERSLWFVCFAFGRQLDSQDPHQRSLANAFMGTLCDRCSCECKTVRFRCCQCMRLSLDQLPDQSEIDEDVASTVYDALMVRVHDRSYDVRTQALWALDRFKTPGHDNQYIDDAVVQTYVTTMDIDPHPNPRAAAMNCMPITDAMNVHICERTDDVSEIVRIAAFRMILSKISPNGLSQSWRGAIMRTGLKDRSDFVRRLAQETVIRWYDQAVHEDVHALLTLFGSAHTDILHAVLEAILERRLKAVMSWNETMTFNMDTMTDWDAVFWKILLCGYKKRADALGQMAAVDADSAAASQSLFDAIDHHLPSSLNEFVDALETLLKADRMKACCECIQIFIDCFNFTDEGDRQITARLFDQLCRHGLHQEIQDWYPIIMKLGRCVWPDVSDFIAAVLTALESSITQTVHTETSEMTPVMRHWLKASVEMLSLIPLRTVDVFYLGSPSFTVQHLFQIFQSLIESMSDDSDLMQWVIKGIGICLAFQLPSNRHHHLQCLWNAAESPETSTSIAAIDTLSTLALSYGIRSIDGKRQPPVLSRPFPAIWECRLFDHEGDGAAPVHLMNMLHWEQDLHGDVKVAVVQSLCKLLTINVAHRSLGMHLGECIQCLCPLVALFVFDMDDGDHKNQIQQLLKVFFDRYAQSHIMHQYLFRAGFLPMLRYCLEMATAMGLNINPVVKFLGNLLLAPLQGRQLTEIEERDIQEERAKMNIQLISVLLWEMMACPIDIHAGKTYIQSIWKLLMDIHIEDSDESDRIVVLHLAEELMTRRRLLEKQWRTLKSKLELDEELNAAEGDDIEQMKIQLDGYIDQLGTHPFSDED